MGLIPIISYFSPWQLGVSTLVGATSSLISKWWDNYPLIPGIGYVLLKLYHKWVGCFPCNHKNNHFMIFWHKCKAIAIRCIPDFIGFLSFEVDYSLLHLGLIPISWYFYPRQLGFSTYVGATASSISKWWDIHPAIHGIGYVNLRLYHLQVGCFLCYHKNNHIWSFMDPFLLIAVWFIPDFIGIFSFEVVNFLKQMGLIPVSWKFLPMQLGISTLVGATTSSISKWWDIYPAIHWIGIYLQGYFWNTLIKKGIDGFQAFGLILKKKVGNVVFCNLEDCGLIVLMRYLFARGWDFIQGQFRNSWIIILEELLKSNWISLGNKEGEDNWKKIWKCWDLLENNGFSIILSRALKNLFWSLLDSKVKIGKKVINYLVEKIGKNCMKNIVQSSKLIAILGFSFVWRYLQTIVVLNDLANDFLELDVPWKLWKTNIIQTVDYLIEYEAIFWGLTWRKIGSYMKIDDLEDFVNWMIHRVRRSSKKSKYHDKEDDILRSFHFEDSPGNLANRAHNHDDHHDQGNKEPTTFHENDEVPDPNNCLGNSFDAPIEGYDTSEVASGVLDLKDKRLKALSDSDSGDVLSSSTSPAIVATSQDTHRCPSPPCTMADPNIDTPKGSHVKPVMEFAKRDGVVEGVSENISHGSSIAAYESGVERHANDELYETSAKIDGALEDCSDSDVRDLVREFPSAGILSPVVSTPNPPSGSISDVPWSFQPLTSATPPVTPPLSIEDGQPVPLCVGDSKSTPLMETRTKFGKDSSGYVGKDSASLSPSVNMGLFSYPESQKDPHPIDIDVSLTNVGMGEEYQSAACVGCPMPINCNPLVGDKDFNAPVHPSHLLSIRVPATPLHISSKNPCVGHDFETLPPLSVPVNDFNTPPSFFGPNSPNIVQQALSFADIVKGCPPFNDPPLVDAPSTTTKPTAVNDFNSAEAPPIPSLKLDFINEIETSDDDFLIIPSDILANGSTPFERTLYGYFVGDRLVFPFVKDRTHELWKEHGLCDIFINDDDVFFFKFDNDVDGLSLIASKLGKPLEVDSYTTTMCERATGRAVYARILIEMSAKTPWAKEIKIKAFTAKGTTSTTLRVEYSWNPKRCDHCNIFGHDHVTCPMHTISTPDPKPATSTQKEVDNEGFQTVKRRPRTLPIPKKKIPIYNRKGNGPTLKISQVYKPVTRTKPKKKVSTNMFDALSHQRVYDIDDDSRVPPVIHSSASHPVYDALPSYSHGGCISSPIDQG
ncbi:unnamed protein product [Lactuca saligna]|uniref:DUF4283 domain-containing protein n=1 Tax=Lactuca saligna TaxID=75948 RepID=A0AA35XZS9_LACSI|nr:unnamed protein product [Lactuca saligna]